ncbi:predicted protein [Nematostella vectensis]|uniref:Uncharacterized protein n=1 Tax=Nematostella vectensis TaxID=45351 RepID=A7SA22_NEMVE|nr:predicted protein [Nematostella vectensis]|eukprot:XP_001631479.1 predicted protein [Nematostella vectensis]
MESKRSTKKAVQKQAKICETLPICGDNETFDEDGLLELGNNDAEIPFLEGRKINLKEKKISPRLPKCMGKKKKLHLDAVYSGLWRRGSEKIIEGLTGNSVNNVAGFWVSDTMFKACKGFWVSDTMFKACKGFWFQYFAIQYYGECWSGTGENKSFSRYGPSNNCWSGVGGEWTNAVYRLQNMPACSSQLPYTVRSSSASATSSRVGTWCSAKSDMAPWLEINFDKPTRITGNTVKDEQLAVLDAVLSESMISSDEMRNFIRK